MQPEMLMFYWLKPAQQAKKLHWPKAGSEA
jgi:hypothetical protein